MTNAEYIAQFKTCRNACKAAEDWVEQRSGYSLEDEFSEAWLLVFFEHFGMELGPIHAESFAQLEADFNGG